MNPTPLLLIIKVLLTPVPYSANHAPPLAYTTVGDDESTYFLSFSFLRFFSSLFIPDSSLRNLGPYTGPLVYSSQRL